MPAETKKKVIPLDKDGNLCLSCSGEESPIHMKERIERENEDRRRKGLPTYHGSRRREDGAMGIWDDRTPEKIKKDEEEEKILQEYRRKKHLTKLDPEWNQMPDLITEKGFRMAREFGGFTPEYLEKVRKEEKLKKAQEAADLTRKAEEETKISQAAEKEKKIKEELEKLNTTKPNTNAPNIYKKQIKKLPNNTEVDKKAHLSRILAKTTVSVLGPENDCDD